MSNLTKFYFAAVLWLTSYSILLAATAVTHNGITWKFDRDYNVGQYITGDYYVVDPGTGVKIVSVTPGPSSGRNGSMVNPTSSTAQGFDDRISYYSAGTTVTFPVTLSAASGIKSLISTESYVSAEAFTPTWSRKLVSSTHARLLHAGVLTIVPSAPSQKSFRPPLFGTKKPTYSVSMLNLSRLPRIPAPGDVPNSSFYERGLRRPWLQFLKDWTCRAMHPLENMLNYHEDIGQFLSDASCILVTDKFSDDLLYFYVQQGIDSYHTFDAVDGDSACFRMPVIFAGVLLGNAEMRDFWLDGRNNTAPRDAEKFYYWNERKSTVSSKLVPAGQTWTGAKVFFRKQVGNTEHEHLHPSEWGQVENGGGKKQEDYRHCCDSIPHVGMAVAAKILGMTREWNNPALFDYVDRWMTEPFAAQYESVVEKHWGSLSGSAQEAGSAFIRDLWRGYLLTIPESPTDAAILP